MAASRDDILRDLLSRMDILEARVDELEQDGWDAPFDPASTPSAVGPAPVEADDYIPPQAGGGPLPHRGTPDDDVDPNNPDVIQAQRRKRAERWLKKPVAPRQDVKFQVLNVDGIHTIKVHKPTEQQTAARQEFIRLGMLDNIKSLPVKEAKEAYMKGGPLWLHAFDREFVVGLPGEARAWMAQDVYLTDPAAAGNLAKDILKFEDPAEQSAWAMTKAEQTYDNPNMAQY